MLPCLEPCHIRCAWRDCSLSRSRGSANAQKKYDPGATDTEIKIGNIMPYSGPASAYATIGKTEAAYFNKINTEGGINGRKINFISYDDGYNPAEDRRAGAQAGRGRRGAADLQPAGHAGQHRDPEIHERQEGAADFRLERRRQMERPEELSVDHRLAAELPGRGADLCRLHPEELSRQDHRRAVSERRFRQGLRHRPARRPRRPGQQADRHRILLRDRLADGGFAGRADQGRQPRHLHQHLDAEIRRPGDQEARRAEMESGPFPHQRLGVGRQRHEAGRLRERPGHSQRGLSEGSQGSAVEERSRA